jgi:autotransporter passenger strand-loop-strand repeat protein
VLSESVFGGVTQNILSGAVVSGEEIFGAGQNVSSGGTAIDMLVNGGIQTVYSRAPPLEPPWKTREC